MICDSALYHTQMFILNLILDKQSAYKFLYLNAPQQRASSLEFLFLNIQYISNNLVYCIVMFINLNS
jgi:hypothetical protein